MPLTQEGYRVSLGPACDTLWDFRQACFQARLLSETVKKPWNDIRRDEDHCRCMLADSAGREAAYLTVLLDRFCAFVSPGERRALLESIRCYYDAGRSVTKAAQQLYIHKNTLQYRVKRTLDALGIQDLPPFFQEYLVRMLLERQERNLGLEKP